ncbi:MAG: 23S rRNA (adenine(2503)-C(2))-methyltransferase RlmN, partial [Spirochaetes bacterium]
MKIPVAALMPEEINSLFQLSRKYQGEQIFKWIQGGTLGFESMTNVSKTLRASLAEKALISSHVAETLVDSDGTVKLKLKLYDNYFIETVLLKDKRGRKTACLSTQAGCGMGCAFCRTGKMGLKRNLTDYEIVEQFLLLVSKYGSSDEGIKNIVFMGMGEPLENLANLKKAIGIFHHEDGNGIGFRRMTISTCGIVPRIIKLADTGLPVRLAFSLITADPDLRKKLMPVSLKYPLKEVKKALVYYQEKTGKRITLEIVLLGGINDREEDIEYLLKFISPLKVLVNIIPWNPAEDIPFSEPSAERVNWFRDRIVNAGIPVIERFRRGRGINGACGQLCVINKQDEPVVNPIL